MPVHGLVKHNTSAPREEVSFLAGQLFYLGENIQDHLELVVQCVGFAPGEWAHFDAETLPVSLEAEVPPNRAKEERDVQILRRTERHEARTRDDVMLCKLEAVVFQAAKEQRASVAERMVSSPRFTDVPSPVFVLRIVGEERVDVLAEVVQAFYGVLGRNGYRELNGGRTREKLERSPPHQVQAISRPAHPE